FDLKEGEVHIILGENGAGKSTLMKVLAGAYIPEEGKIFINGKEVAMQTPKQAQSLGIGIIYQEFNLVPYMTVAENIFIDDFPRNKLGILDHKKMRKASQEILNSMNMNVDPSKQIVEISTAQQQMVEVAKAMKHNSKILIMDEPTASLSDREIEQLFSTIRDLKSKGIGIIYISHRMQELWEIGDRVSVLRDGHYVGTRDLKDVTPAELVTLMVGREISFMFKRTYCEKGEEVLRVEHLSSKESKLTDISINLCRNEIVGLAGLIGSGRTELARAIFGIDPFSEGKVFLFGEEIKKFDTTRMIKKGVALLPEDRKAQGLALILSLAENIVLASLEGLFPRRFVSKRKEREIAEKYIKDLQIVTPHVNRRVQFLSGGNQQKAVLAKWLCTNADIMIFDEPTRGIDVKAKAEIHGFMNDLAKNGVAILMISSDLPEIIGMADRIYVMRERKIVAEINHQEATQENVVSYATAANENVTEKAKS
ncbi:MAG: sugar ABC transporter ATP-binding protein, partial [Treponema sp.]|nr:sugar ABC transporter ATP-binding protein [Treponema sp.]